MPVVTLSTEITCREDFAAMCNARGLVGQAAEIGTHHGHFAVAFLRAWQGACLVCVDDWQPYHEMPFPRDVDKLIAAINLAPFPPRIRIVMAQSVEAASREEPSAFGFIYIDAGHTYDQVRQDLAAWWPRVLPNGILAGHDFESGHPDVMRAVTEFADEQQRTIYLTHERDVPASWYILKAGG